MASQTREGVNGMSACLIPKGLSASTTALTMAGGEPTVADSPIPLAPIGMVRRRRHRVARLPVGHLERRRDQVVHERGSQAVTLRVEGDHLHESHTDAVGEAAVDLALDDHLVDPRAAVVDGYEPSHLHLGRARIDVHHADIGPEGVGEILRVVADLRFEAALDTLGEVARAMGTHRDLLDGHRL